MLVGQSNLLQSVTLRPTGPHAGGSLLLDAIGDHHAIWSFRKLRTAYAGNCVRIRRSSDDTEQNFGFSANVVDTAGIASFVGGGSGFIVTWYDQSANGHDATQATAAAQPQFIASGINSLPTARFDGGDILSTASVADTVYGDTQFTFIGVMKQTGTDDFNCLFEAASTQIYLLATYGDTVYWDYGGSGSRVSASQPTGWDDNPHIIEAFRQTSNNQEVVIDGASLVSGTKTGTIGASGAMNIGAQVGPAEHLTGDVSEIITLLVDTGSTNRGTIRTSQSSYYGITV
jgi:hypothetical protein